VINVTIDTCILWLTVRWRPKPVFSWKRLKRLYSFGWKLLVSSLLDTVYKDLSSLIIGKLYSSSDLAYFNQGDKFPRLIITNINTSIDSVLLPTLSDAQDEKEKLKYLTSSAIKLSCFILAPVMIGMAAVAEPMVRIILTDKWLPCVPMLRIFCFIYLLYPIHTANLNAIKAMGRSDIFLKLEIIKKALGLVVLAVSMWFGVEAIAWSFFLTGLLSLLVNAWPNKKLLGYGYREQFRDVMSAMMSSAVMGILVYMMGRLLGSSLPVLVLQIAAGAVIYVVETKLFMPEAWRFVMNGMKGRLGRKA
jgi:O-antigen/teichoic acid export membrane protein